MVIWHHISRAIIVVHSEIILVFIHIIEKNTTRPVKSVFFQIFREKTAMFCMVLNMKLLGVHAISGYRSHLWQLPVSWTAEGSDFESL
jgi:hypothetical protein